MVVVVFCDDFFGDVVFDVVDELLVGCSQFGQVVGESGDECVQCCGSDVFLSGVEFFGGEVDLVVVVFDCGVCDFDVIVVVGLDCVEEFFVVDVCVGVVEDDCCVFLWVVEV